MLVSVISIITIIWPLARPEILLRRILGRGRQLEPVDSLLSSMSYAPRSASGACAASQWNPMCFHQLRLLLLQHLRSLYVSFWRCRNSCAWLAACLSFSASHCPNSGRADRLHPGQDLSLPFSLQAFLYGRCDYAVSSQSDFAVVKSDAKRFASITLSASQEHQGVSP